MVEVFPLIDSVAFMSELLRVEHLKKYFKTSKGFLHAVDDISFSVAEGETLGIVGESGCGKSTLGRTLVHLTESTEGHIFFDGKDITHVSKGDMNSLRRRMQIIFQDPFSSLNPRMTVAESIADPMRVCHMGSRREVDAQVDRLMDTVGLARRFKYAYPHELDGGRRQRIGIARALSLNPRFIVCDEPVSALDVSIQAQILNLLQDLQEETGLTYIFITHDLSVVKHISNHICVMYLGTMVEMCESDELFEVPLHPYTQALLSAIPVAEVRENHDRIILRGEITSPIEPKPGCRFAARCDCTCDKCFSQTPELKEVMPGHVVCCHRSKEMLEQRAHNLEN